MAYKIWSVTPPQGSSPTPLPKEAFFINAEYSDKESAQVWLDENEYEGYEIYDEATGVTGGGGGIRPTSSGGRPI